VKCACAIFSSVVCPALQYFFAHYLINSMIFEKENLLNIKCVVLFSLKRLSEIFLILRRIEGDIIKNVSWSSFNVSNIFVRF